MLLLLLLLNQVHVIACPPSSPKCSHRNLTIPKQVSVHRYGLHSTPGTLPFTFYPAMPGNSTACPHEKWHWQRPLMAARMGPAATDACFAGAASVACPVTTLAQVFREQQLGRVDLLKVGGRVGG